eukprot:g25660.t1
MSGNYKHFSCHCMMLSENSKQRPGLLSESRPGRRAAGVHAIRTSPLPNISENMLYHFLLHNNNGLHLLLLAFTLAVLSVKAAAAKAGCDHDARRPRINLRTVVADLEKNRLLTVLLLPTHFCRVTLSQSHILICFHMTYISTKGEYSLFISKSGSESLGISKTLSLREGGERQEGQWHEKGVALKSLYLKLTFMSNFLA